MPFVEDKSIMLETVMILISDNADIHNALILLKTDASLVISRLHVPVLELTWMKVLNLNTLNGQSLTQTMMKRWNLTVS